MRRTTSLFVALLSAGLAAMSATRPRYGSVLRVEIRAAAEPSEWPVAPLLFETLPEISVSHEESPRRWTYRVRPGIKLHDGSPLTPAAIAAALEIPGAAVSSSGDAVVITSDQEDDLAAELARHPIIIRPAEGPPQGTGPFRIVRWEAGRHAVLAAHEDYWKGRPFLDGVELEMGRPVRDQVLDLELGKADVVEIAPGDVRRISDRDWPVWSSAPVDLIALTGRANPALEALSLAIDRAVIHTVLLQRQGEATGAIVPQWLSGFAFLFPPAQDLQRARKVVGDLAANARTLSISYEPAEPLARILAERIAVNARDAGLAVQATPRNPRADLRLIRLRLPVADAWSALEAAASALGGAAAPARHGGPDALYGAERKLIEASHVIPLFHIPELYAASPRVKAWLRPAIGRSGRWHFADVWLDGDRP